MSAAPNPTREELSAMLRAARTAPQPAARPRLGSIMLFAAILVAILAIFPHADAGRPFLLRRGESVSPAVKFEEEITMSRVRAVGSAIAGSLALAPSLALSPAAHAQQAVQWRVQDGGNGHWYQGVVIPPSTVRTWAGSRDFAIGRGGDLAAIATLGEANWVYANIASNLALWDGDFGPYIGLYQLKGATEPGGGWVWVDGTPNAGAVSWYWNQPDDFAAQCGGDQFAAYWTGGPWFPSPRSYIGDVSGAGHCCCESGVGRIPSFLIEWSADCNNDGLVDYGQIRFGQLADTNNNGVPDDCEAPPCPGDVTGNNAIDGIDLAAVLAAWGGGKSQFDCDIDDDGTVGGSDLAIVLAGWGACP